MEERWDGLDVSDEIDAFDASSGSAADAGQAGDDAVDGLDKITAQMSGGEHRPEQQEMCRLVPAALSAKKVVVATATKRRHAPLLLAE